MAGKATSEQESWWVLQAQSGSREALNELFKSVQEPLFRYVVSLVNDKHLAEDILHSHLSQAALVARATRVSRVELSDCDARGVSIFEAGTVMDRPGSRRRRFEYCAGWRTGLFARVGEAFAGVGW